MDIRLGSPLSLASGLCTFAVREHDLPVFATAFTPLSVVACVGQYARTRHQSDGCGVPVTRDEAARLIGAKTARDLKTIKALDGGVQSSDTAQRAMGSPTVEEHVHASE